MDPYERKLVERLGRLPRAEASSELRQRIMAAVDAEPRLKVVPRRRKIVARALSGALAAAAAIFLWLGLQGGGTEAAGRMIEVALSQPGEAYEMAEAAPLQEWFTDRIEQPFEIPEIEDAFLLGGHMTEWGGVQGALVNYQIQGRSLTYVMTPDSEIIEGLRGSDDLVSLADNGHGIVVWLESGTARGVMGDMPMDELRAIARQCRDKSLS